MNVGLNLIYLVPRATGGMETVARELIPELVSLRPDMRFTAFVNRETEADGGILGDLLENVTVPVNAVNRLEWVRGEQLLLPALAARSHIDLMHSMGATAPLRGSFARVVSIYDFNYQLVPETHSALRGRGLAVLIRAGARRSQRIVCCSQNTARDATRLLGVGDQRIDVVPLGLGARSDVRPTSELALRARFDLGDRPLLFTLSDKRPHKNLIGLIEALALLPETSRPVLLIAGYRTPYEQQVQACIDKLGLARSVRMTTWISDADREGLYALATAFVFPSLYEGFGLPVLEAMARGVPVACSDAASLPELVGDAALSFDPRDVSAISASIARLLDDGALRRRLVGAGLERAARFTWQRTAQLTVASYECALAAR